MLGALSFFAPLALEGEWNDIRAILVVVLSFLVLVGSIYMLVWSNFGAKVGYLIIMVSFMAFTITMSLIWLVGAPGTPAATGPRAGKPSDKLLVATEPHWIPFVNDSEQGQEFQDATSKFPTDWRSITAKTTHVFPGNIDARGEFDTLQTLIAKSLAARVREQNEKLPAEQQGLAVRAKDWDFRLPDSEAITDEEKAVPIAQVAFYQEDTPLLFGVRIPATDKHGEVTVFAFRDKGRTFLYSLYFLIVGIVGFIVHVWLLGRTELRQREREANEEVKLA